jgi:phage gpG-like protein
MKITFKFPKIKKAKIKKEVEAACIRGMKNAVEEEFNKSIDPYREKWAPKKIPNGKKTLYASGRMRRGFRYSKDGVTNNTPYLQYHQTGTTKMVRRAIFPYAKMEGSIWQVKMSNAVMLVLKKMFK